jgi:hypothetical protein
LLEAFNCERDCSSIECQRNFFILQAHHDHCRGDLVPEPMKDAIHFYEDVCDECISTYNLFRLCLCIYVHCRAFVLWSLSD